MKAMTLFRSEHKYFTPVAALAVHAVTNLVYFFNELCKPIEIYIYARKKHPITSYPTAKHPKTTNLRLQTYGKNQ